MITGTVPLAALPATEPTVVDRAALVGAAAAGPAPAETAASVSAEHTPADTSAPEKTLPLPRIQ
jgi:hypothetical protein